MINVLILLLIVIVRGTRNLLLLLLLLLYYCCGWRFMNSALFCINWYYQYLWKGHSYKSKTAVLILVIHVSFDVHPITHWG